MTADTKFNAALGRQAGVALNHAVLHLDRAAHGVNDAAKLYEAPVARSLDDASVMHGNGRVDQVTPKRPEPGQRAIFVGPGEPAVPDHIRDQDRCYLAGLAHGAPSAAMQISTNTGCEPGLN